MSEKLSRLLGRLNEEQRRAAMIDEGPALVVAGAGSGKTGVLTTRIARLILEGKARPWEILAVTFTNKAAREMRERISGIIGEEAAKELWMGSFHGISLKILRKHATEAGLKSAGFRIFDTDEQLRVIKKEAEALGFLEGLEGTELKGALADFHKTIENWKEEGYTTDQVEKNPGIDESLAMRDMLMLYKNYQRSLVASNGCDFADMLLYPVDMFRKQPHVLRSWNKKFKYVLVDEFQDTNRLQYEWLKHLSGNGNLFAVGDPDQSIYEWRGARPDIMMGFTEDFPGTQMVTVDRNYRSTQEILDVANAVVSMNERLGEKRLRSPVSGPPPETAEFANEHIEAEAVASAAKLLLARGTPPQEIAVLMRSAGQMRVIESAFRRTGIAYEIVGGQRFDERMEVRDALAYLRLAMDPSDDEAFLRIANRPTRGLGNKTASSAVGERLKNGGDLPAAMRALLTDKKRRITANARKEMEDLASLIECAHRDSEAGRRPGDILNDMLQKSGYVSWIEQEDEDKGPQRVDVLDDMIAEGRSGKFLDIASWLQEIALLAAADLADDVPRKIRISTVHAAKGLEYDVVFTPCVEDEILPHKRALLEPYGLAEERRIAHVAWTRPRKRLFISCARARYTQPKMPSRFFAEAGLDDPEPKDAFETVVEAPKPEKSGPAG